MIQTIHSFFTIKLLNFYDGVIKSASGTGTSIQNNTAATLAVEDGYHLYKSTENGVESAVLVLPILEEVLTSQSTSSYFLSL